MLNGYGYRISGGEEIIATRLILRQSGRDAPGPITVRWLPEVQRYELLAGHEEYDQALEGGALVLPCIIVGEGALSDVLIARSEDEIDQES